MRYKLLTTLGLVLLWGVFVLAAVGIEALYFAAPPVPVGDSTAMQAHLTGAMQEAADDRRVGAAGLAIIENGEIILERGFGRTGTDPEKPVDPTESRFVVGSVSKMVTAWGVMKLVQEGRIQLDDPVIPRLTRWKFQGKTTVRDRLTLRGLLSHTAGLQDGPMDGGFWEVSEVTADDNALILERPADGKQRAYKILHEPGTAFVYGNSSTTLLSFLVEDITGEPFPTYMDEKVFRPLGMNASTFDLKFVPPDTSVADYDSGLNVLPARRSAFASAVGLHTTARDLARLASAYTRENPVLRKETIAEMLRPQPATGGGWGLGHQLFVENGAGSHIVGHSGGAAPSWGALVRVNPATGNGIAMTVSGSRGAVNQLPHDWTYVETGRITTEAMRQKAQNRALIAALAIALGTVMIIGLQILRYRFRRS